MHALNAWHHRIFFTESRADVDTRHDQKTSEHQSAAYWLGVEPGWQTPPNAESRSAFCLLFPVEVLTSQRVSVMLRAVQLIQLKRLE